ncbi:MAG: hypothetical protein KGK11_02240 [Sphingomonadales bacterium]|nr:hypothetical protein [Sphingomonadales bacterium]
MNRLISMTVLAGLATASPAAAHHPMHHSMASHPASVTIDGKDYKVCGGAVQDDCVNPRQAGLHYGDVPTHTYHRHHHHHRAMAKPRS